MADRAKSAAEIRRLVAEEKKLVEKERVFASLRNTRIELPAKNKTSSSGSNTPERVEETTDISIEDEEMLTDDEDQKEGVEKVGRAGAGADESRVGSGEQMTVKVTMPHESIEDRQKLWDLVQMVVPDVPWVDATAPIFEGPPEARESYFFIPKGSTSEVYVGYGEWSELTTVDMRKMTQIKEYTGYAFAPDGGWRLATHKQWFYGFLKKTCIEKGQTYPEHSRVLPEGEEPMSFSDGSPRSSPRSLTGAMFYLCPRIENEKLMERAPARTRHEKTYGDVINFVLEDDGLIYFEHTYCQSNEAQATTINEKHRVDVYMYGRPAPRSGWRNRKCAHGFERWVAEKMRDITSDVWSKATMRVESMVSNKEKQTEEAKAVRAARAFMRAAPVQESRERVAATDVLTVETSVRNVKRDAALSSRESPDEPLFTTLKPALLLSETVEIKERAEIFAEKLWERKNGVNVEQNKYTTQFVSVWDLSTSLVSNMDQYREDAVAQRYKYNLLADRVQVLENIRESQQQAIESLKASILNMENERRTPRSTPPSRRNSFNRNLRIVEPSISRESSGGQEVVQTLSQKELGNKFRRDDDSDDEGAQAMVSHEDDEERTRKAALEEQSRVREERLRREKKAEEDERRRVELSRRIEASRDSPERRGRSAAPSERTSTSSSAFHRSRSQLRTPPQRIATIDDFPTPTVYPDRARTRNWDGSIIKAGCVWNDHSVNIEDLLQHDFGQGAFRPNFSGADLLDVAERLIIHAGVSEYPLPGLEYVDKSRFGHHYDGDNDPGECTSCYSCEYTCDCRVIATADMRRRLFAARGACFLCRLKHRPHQQRCQGHPIYCRLKECQDFPRHHRFFCSNFPEDVRKTGRINYHEKNRM